MLGTAASSVVRERWTRGCDHKPGLMGLSQHRSSPLLLDIAVRALPPGPRVGYSAAMTVTLCIDTSGPHCSLALAADDEIYVEQRLLEQ